MIGLLAAVGDPPVDVSAHLAQATTALWLLLATVLALIVVRFDVFKRMWLQVTDPRPVACFRIVFGLVVLWALLDMLPYAATLFSDDGMFAPEVARARFGRSLNYHWNPEHGFAHAYSWLYALGGRASLLHFGSPLWLTYSVFAAGIGACFLMIVGLWTRLSTLMCWLCVHTLFLYAPLWHAGGDTVLRIFLLLGVCSRWGEAYSLDRLRTLRRSLADPNCRGYPRLRSIPAWPVHMMLVQLAVIYGTTGLVKTGIAWRDGTALYYASSLAHFYRFPEQVTLVSYLHGLHILPALTWLTRLWEVGFPLALLGVMLRAYERAVAANTWPSLPRWRRFVSYALIIALTWIASYIAGLATLYYFPHHYPNLSPEQAGGLAQALAFAIPIAAIGLYIWLRRIVWIRSCICNIFLGRRLWLGLGLGFHLGIELMLNVGLFVQVMIVPYLVWLRPSELDRGWRFWLSQPYRPGEGPRPTRPGVRQLLRPLDRLRFRKQPPSVTIYHPPDAVRRVALLRCWDLGKCLSFKTQQHANQVTVLVDGNPVPDEQAGIALCRVFPAWMWLAWFARWSLVRGRCQQLADRVLQLDRSNP